MTDQTTKAQTFDELRAALADHIAGGGRGGTELPWSWTDTGEKSNDWAIGTCAPLNDEDAPLIAGYVDSGRFDSEDCPAESLVIPIDEVCRAENADGFSDAALIVAAVNAAPQLLAAIESSRSREQELLEVIERIANFSPTRDTEADAMWDAAFAETKNCEDCKTCKARHWPPSETCDKHYTAMHRASERQRMALEGQQMYGPQEIANTALRKARAALGKADER